MTCRRSRFSRLQGFQPLGDLAGHAGAHAAVALEPLHPLIERLRRAADLPSYRGNSRPTRGVFALVIHNQAPRAASPHHLENAVDDLSHRP